MSVPEGLGFLLALAIPGTVMAILVALWKRTPSVVEAVWSWSPSARRARRLAEDAAYERWKREGGGAWFDSWWESPEATRPRAEGAAARPEVPGRMSIAEARRKLDGLLELTVARGATPAEAATARAIAERLKADYDLH